MTIKMSVRYGKNVGSINEVALEDSIVAFFVKDEDDDLLGVRSFDFSELNDEQAHRVFLYGCNKLVTDRTSDKKIKLEKLAEMQEVFDLLVSGEWAKERTVGAIVVGVEVEALAQLKELTVPAAQKALAAYDKDTRKKILASEAVVKLAAEMREERKEQEVVSLDDMI